MMLAGRFLRDQTGSAATEMALITPLLIVLMFGGFEAGYYFWNEHKVVKAVRDGARYAGRMPFTAYNCPSGAGAGTVATTPADYGAFIKNVTRTGTIDASRPTAIDNWTNTQVTITVSCETADADGNTMKTGIFEKRPSVVVVRVSADTSYTPLFSTLGFSTVNLGLRASSEAVVMGL